MKTAISEICSSPIRWAIATLYTRPFRFHLRTDFRQFSFPPSGHTLHKKVNVLHAMCPFPNIPRENSDCSSSSMKHIIRIFLCFNRCFNNFKWFHLPSPFPIQFKNHASICSSCSPRMDMGHICSSRPGTRRQARVLSNDVVFPNHPGCAAEPLFLLACFYILLLIKHPDFL